MRRSAMPRWMLARVGGPSKLLGGSGRSARLTVKKGRTRASARSWSVRAGAHSGFDIPRIESGRIKQHLLKLLGVEPLDGRHGTSAVRASPCWLA